MATLDPNLATFVVNEYRYSQVDDAAIKADFPNAAEIIIQTNLSAAAAQAVAEAYHTLTKSFAQAYEVEIHEAVDLDAFEGSLPHFTMVAPQYATDGRVFKLVHVEVDPFRNRSIMVIKG